MESNTFFYIIMYVYDRSDKKKRKVLEVEPRMRQKSERLCHK